MKKSTKNTTKIAYKRFTPMTAEQQENANINANYYREKAQLFYNTSSFSAPTAPVGNTATPKDITAVLKAAEKVRHNPKPKQAAISSIVMVAGVPHKMRDGKLVPMIPANKSKKWDIVEA